MISHHIEARRRHQRGESGKQILRLEDYVGGPVAPAVPQLVQEPAVGQEQQPIRGNRGPRGIAAQTLEAEPISGRNADACMDAEAGNRCAAPAIRDRKVFQFDGISGFGDACPRARANGNAPGNGSAVKLGKQGLILQKPIVVISSGLRPKPSALEEPGHPPRNTFCKPGDFRVTRRRRAPERELAFVIDYVDPVERNYVWFRTMSSTFISA